VIRGPEQRFHLTPLEDLADGSFLHPHRPGEIRRWNDAFALGQLGECFWRALERERMRSLGVDDREHFTADAEGEVAAPLDVFLGSRQREAECSNGIDRHGW